MIEHHELCAGEIRQGEKLPRFLRHLEVGFGFIEVFESGGTQKQNDVRAHQLDLSLQVG